MPTAAGISVFGLALAAAACAGSQVAPAAPSPGPPRVAWSAMTADLRGAYMRKVVMPKMKELFVAFDGARYEKMSCTTCHGAGATNGTFKMPNDRLPKLPGSPEEFKRLAADKPAICQLMLTKVKPTMAALLGMPERTADTRSGFGCTNCHAR